MAPHYDTIVTQLCQTQKFSLLVDESSDRGGDKMIGMLVRVFKPEEGCVMIYFLAGPVCNICTTDNLFATIDKIMRGRQIPWSNMVDYMSDNASVMVGQHNSVLTRIHKKQPNVFDFGCVCHIAKLAG